MSDLEKMATIEILEKPTIISKLKRFLRVIGFFKKYIQKFEQITKFLNNMISIKFDNYQILDINKAQKVLKK